jgi:2-keto-3-deoxy-6-phosphogluconate aldolase
MTFDTLALRLSESPVLAVLRDYSADAAVRAAESCWSNGVELVEVSVSHDPQL